ncbi:hypothetical protein DSO57_1013433 [Entomophthora muscae]|uniref:Uncharacterized protein n=1 Tax=Entomophthora muscae TaxID=34485 RepID=A0ACC2TTE1_9FUNG|nr:hypothetical protein DSO57_1013433 [Entomophthora muscae]
MSVAPCTAAPSAQVACTLPGSYSCKDSGLAGYAHQSGVLNPIIPTGLPMMSIAVQALLKLSVELAP